MPLKVPPVEVIRLMGEVRLTASSNRKLKFEHALKSQSNGWSYTVAPENAPLTDVTAEVDQGTGWLKFVAPLNVSSRLVTFVVSQFRVLLRPVASLKVFFKFVTFGVFQFDMPVLIELASLKVSSRVVVSIAGLSCAVTLRLVDP